MNNESIFWFSMYWVLSIGIIILIPYNISLFIKDKTPLFIEYLLFIMLFIIILLIKPSLNVYNKYKIMIGESNGT